jgi:membrane associated rhomboid family serine protease
MQPPPSPTRCVRYPVTAIVAMLAIAATLRAWPAGGIDVDLFRSNTGNCLHEPWRLLTPALFHGGVFHLLFDVCWLWAFGSAIEREFGHIATLAIFCFLQAGSVAAELALFRGGIGLSGIVYGLFGLLWVLSQTDPRFCDVVDHGVIELMVGWFILCIVLTVAEVWSIALVAHTAGCILGALLGWTISAGRQRRRLWRGALTAAVFLLCLAGGTVARLNVNLVRDNGYALAEEGQAAWKAGKTEAAIKLYTEAVEANPRVQGWWTSLGLAYQQAGLESDARNAFSNADALKQHRPLPDWRPWEQPHHESWRQRSH